MGSHPAPTRQAHHSFCLTEGWDLVRKADGATVRHHVTFRLPLPDGRILRTRISRPVNKDTYGAGVWKHILRDQLDVDEDTFWACVQDKVLPDRGTLPPPTSSVPVDLFNLLVTKAGLPETQVLAMTREQAVAAAGEYWMRGGS